MADEELGCCPPALTEHDAALVQGGDDGEEEVNAQLARLARALGHPARVAILRMLIRRESCVCGEIVEVLPLAQSTVSQHLKQLKEASLIRGEIDGPRVCYCVEPAMVAQLKALVAAL